MTDNDDAYTRRLNQVIADYRSDMRSGHTPDRERLYEEHPDLADDLASLFESHDALSEHIKESKKTEFVSGILVVVCLASLFVAVSLLRAQGVWFFLAVCLGLLSLACGSAAFAIAVRTGTASRDDDVVFPFALVVGMVCVGVAWGLYALGWIPALGALIASIVLVISAFVVIYVVARRSAIK